MIIILDDLEFMWEERQVEKVIELWNAGLHIKEIAKEIKFYTKFYTKQADKEDEIALLIMHLRRQELIDTRRNGVIGINK